MLLLVCNSIYSQLNFLPTYNILFLENANLTDATFFKNIFIFTKAI